MTLSLPHIVRRRMPELDALRGIAILLVILHNAALDNIGVAQSIFIKTAVLLGNSGWIGVQLFFVLSGFLITGILLDGKGSYRSLKNFYIRRTLRIFPLYYVFLLLFFIVLPYSGILAWKNITNLEMGLYWTYLINWGQPFIGVHFPHLWSLAIEEQYYLFWPLVVLLARDKTLVPICFILIVTAILTRLYLVLDFDPEFSSHAMYTFTIARWDSLAIGSMLAVIVRQQSLLNVIQQYFRATFLVLSLILLVLVAIFRHFSPSGLEGVFNQTVISFWFAMCTLFIITPCEGRIEVVRQLASHPVLCWVGKYSYAIYIFHFPAKLFWFGHITLPFDSNNAREQIELLISNFIGVLLLATIAAYVSWNLLERPFLSLKRYFPR
jgi:peptidoglycan/LPS O-acetylase OafA/YrhL